MNDASSAGSVYPSTSHETTTSNNGDAPAAAAAAADNAEPSQERKRAQRDQQATMLEHLIRNIDIIVYAQLSALYYMEYVSTSC